MYTPQQENAIADEMLGNMITERTGGRVKVTYYHAESLGKAGDFVNMLKGGVVDMANLTLPNTPTQFEMEAGVELPFLGIPNRTVGGNLNKELFTKGYFKGLNEFKVLAYFPTPPMTIFLKKKAETTQDFKGLKLRGTTAAVNQMWEALGASAVSMPITDVYMSLERGVIDGLCTGWEVYLQFKMNEVARYVMWTPPVSSACMFVVLNKDIWNSFPVDIQQAIDQVSTEFEYVWSDRYQDKDKQAVDILSKAGMEVYSLSPSETENIKKLAAPIINSWIADKQAKGLPAQEMIDQAQKILGRYQ